MDSRSALNPRRVFERILNVGELDAEMRAGQSVNRDRDQGQSADGKRILLFRRCAARRGGANRRPAESGSPALGRAVAQDAVRADRSPETDDSDCDGNRRGIGFEEETSWSLVERVLRRGGRKGIAARPTTSNLSVSSELTRPTVLREDEFHFRWAPWARRMPPWDAQ